MRNGSYFQPGILAVVPRAARYMTFSLVRAKHAKGVLSALSVLSDGEEVVVGVSAQCAQQLGASIVGLRPFPRFADAKVKIPATPGGAVVLDTRRRQWSHHAPCARD